MTKPTRRSRGSVFSPENLGEMQKKGAEIDDVLEQLTAGAPAAARLQSVPDFPVAALDARAVPDTGAPITGGPDHVAVGTAATSPASDTSAAPGTSVPQHVVAGPAKIGAPRTAPAAGAGAARTVGAQPQQDSPARAKRSSLKPPEAYLAQDVYLRLVDFSAAEKKQRRVSARPFGVIVMDAIERHAERLATAWVAVAPEAPPAGGLFIRAAKTGSRYRRHALPPKSVSLQGIGPENAQLLDELVSAWGAGSRSALVEQALRFELNM